MYSALFHKIRSEYPEDAWVPLYNQLLDDSVVLKAANTILGKEVSTRGKMRLDFESELAEFSGFDRALALQSGSAALQLSLRSLGVEQDTLVVCPSLTYVACANSILYLDAQPVFLDVEDELPLLDAAKVQAWLEKECALVKGVCYHLSSKKRISAIMLVHLLGEVPDLESFYEISKEWCIPILEDQAQGIGSKVHISNEQRKVVFSFNGNKLLKAGGGGAILSIDIAFIDRCLHLASTARVKGELYRYDAVGYNFLMPAWNAALALAQIPALADTIQGRRDRRETWRSLLPDYNIQLLESRYGEPNGWINGLLIPESQQDSFLKSAKENKLEVGKIWSPLHRSVPYSKFLRDELKNTERFEKLAFLLP